MLPTHDADNAFSDEEVIHFFNKRMPILSERDKLLPLYLIGVGAEDPQENLYRSKGIMFHQMLMVMKGSGILFTPHNDYQVSAGYCILIPKRKGHSYIHTTDDFAIEWISFDGAFSENILSHLKFQEICVFKSRNISTLRNMHQQMGEFSRRRYDAERLSAMLYSFLIEFYKHMLHTQIDKSIVFILEPIKKYIEEHFNLDISLDQLAERFEISKYKLCRNFPTLYGLTLNEYQLSLRVQHAKYLLAHASNLSAKDISAAVGFNDSSYFGKVFKKFEGLTPLEYRNFYTGDTQKPKDYAGQ